MVRTIPLIAALLSGLLLASWTRAAETEARVFKVTVDGKEAGKYTISYTKDDGTLTIGCDAHVKVKVAFVTAYHYDYTGTEVWKDGRLVSLKSSCDDDGKQFHVSAAPSDDGLEVKVNGRAKAVRGDAYLTTACCLPDAKRRPDAKCRDCDLPLMEADNGEEINGKMQHIESGAMNVAGQAIDVTHYRLKSHAEHDLWYDAGERMVRQEWTEDGHKTVLELISLKK